MSRGDLARIGSQVAMRLSLTLLSVSFAVGGALMAFNPPPVGFRRSASLPYVGWLVMAGAVYFAVKIAKPGAPAASGKPPRHGSGKEVGDGKSARFVVSYVFIALCAASSLWWGVISGLLSMLGLGIVMTGMTVAATPLVLAQVKWLRRRRRI